MRNELHRYRIEIITAAVCGTICLGVLLPDVRESVQDWFTPSREAGPATIRAERGQYQIEGATARDAVVERVKALQTATQEMNGMNLANIPRREADRLRRMAVRFHGADFRGVDLHGLDLCGIDFRESDFSGANLSEAKLEGAVLFRARLVGADLSGAHLGPRPRDLANFQWRGNEPGDHDMEFSAQPFQERGGRYLEADFSGAKLTGARIVLATTEALDLRGADLTDANLIFAPPRRTPGPDAVAGTIEFNDATVVRGLKIGGILDRVVPFVAWAVERGAEYRPAAEPPTNPAAPAVPPGTATPPAEAAES